MAPVISILAGVLVALVAWWVVGWAVDRDLPAPGAGPTVQTEETQAEDGFAPVALRRRPGWLWWQGGSLLVTADDGSCHYESRFLHRYVDFAGGRLVDVRHARGGSWWIRSTSGHTRLTFDVKGRQYLLLVPTDQAAWVAASVAKAE